LILNLLYFIIAVFFALIVAGWLYYMRTKKSSKVSFLLFTLRFISVLALVLLLFNPKWKKNVLRIHKPLLVVALDNSSSIKTMGSEKKMKEVLKKIQDNKDLRTKFDIQFLSFGKEVKGLDSLDFSETETNFSKLLNLQAKSSKTTEKIPMLLLTDGNQTKGSDYTYHTGKNPVFPIVFGDTTRYADVSITRLNANHYAFLENQFPVEVFVNYNSKSDISTVLSIYLNNQRVYQKNISLNSSKNSENISLMLPANQIGTHYYTARLSAINGEKNLRNNLRDFTVDVVDEQSKILIYSSFIHPDLSALKQSIESNKQRKVSLSIGKTNDIKLSDFQLIILYQPTSEMKSVFNEIEVLKKNYFIITGTKTDWAFLNKIQPYFSKNISNLKESYRGVYNNNYPNFTLQDFALDNLPPLQDVFGAIQFKTAYETLMYQKIGNTTLESPLLATFTVNNHQNAILFGEGLWQWKMWSKKEKQSFEPFDQFINAIVQYSSNTEKTNQLQLEYDKLIFSNQLQNIKAQYFDQNYKIDTRVSLTLQLTDRQNNKTIKYPFTLTNNEYQVSLKNLKNGDYFFKTIVAGKNIQASGSFRVLDYSVEDQFVSANYRHLNSLANNTGGTIVLENNIDKALSQLTIDKTYKNIQKNTKKNIEIIDWKWLLAIIVLSLSAEWFIRKYRGLI